MAFLLRHWLPWKMNVTMAMIIIAIIVLMIVILLMVIIIINKLVAASEVSTIM